MYIINVELINAMEQNQTPNQENTPEVEKTQLSEQELADLRVKKTKWFEEQLPYLEAQKKYFTLTSEIEELKARQLKSQYEQMSITYAMTQPQEPTTKQHTITQEDLDQNPDLVGKVEVGQVVTIPTDEEQPPRSRTLKK